MNKFGIKVIVGLFIFVIGYGANALDTANATNTPVSKSVNLVANTDNPDVVVTWGTGNEDEDNLVITVDGAEVLRTHVDQLASGKRLVVVDADWFNGYVTWYDANGAEFTKSR